jgi:hypothetical protein
MVDYAMKHRTPGRLKLGTIVLPVVDLREDIVVAADQALHSGLQQPTNVLVAGVDVPALRCTMPLAAAYAAVSLIQTAYAAGTAVEGYLANTVGGVIDSASTHVKFAKTTLCLACAWIDTFQGSEGGEILAEVMVCFFSTTGALDPITRSEANALPALTAIPDNHGIGVLTLNGDTLGSPTGVRYASGLQLTAQRTAGLPFPTGAVPSGMKPVLSLELADMATVRGILGSTGLPISSTTTFTLQKYANSILSVTGQKTLTIAQGFARPSAGGGRHGELWKGGLDLLISSADGSAHGMVIS